MQIVGSENKKHLRGSTHATIHPLASILTVAMVSMMALILPPLCFL